MEYLLAIAVLAAQDLAPLKKAKPEARIVSVRTHPSEVRAGELFLAEFQVEITPGWHIYPTQKTTTGVPTEFAFELAQILGRPEETPKPKVHPAEADQPAYEYLEGTVTIAVPLSLKAGGTPGAREVQGTFKYMICNAETCLPAKTVPVSFTIRLGGGAVAAPPAGVVPAPPPAAAPSPSLPERSFLGMLGLAFLGGLLLNVMPCVLPVLTLKLFSLVGQKNAAPGVRQGAALAYTAGVLLCLNVFALGVILLRSLGRQVGWGFQFQEPIFVISLTTLIFVFSLSLLGVYHLPALATGVAGQAGRQHGPLGHLLTGLFVTLVATPCSAPFLGTGLGFAFTLPSWGILLFFSAAGLGLAFPFLVVGFVPFLFRFMPKPGPWLEVFEKVMGFTLIATAVWLIDTIGTLTGKAGVIGYLAFLTVVSLGVWIFGRWGSEIATLRARLASLGVAVLLSIVAGKLFLVTQIAPAEAAGPVAFRTQNLDYSRAIPWQSFSEENVRALRSQKKPGFIDFTADW